MERCPEEFSDTVIRMGGFHVALNFLSLIGKKYTNSGLDDLLIESGVYAAGTTSALMKGKSYNRGIRGHKLAMEALFRLLWKSFQQWNSQRQAEEEHVIKKHVLDKITECRVSVQNKSVVLENVEELALNMQEVVEMLERFKQDSRSKSKMFAFWEEFCTMVTILLQFIKAERTGNWKLHLSATAAMLPYFFAMDRPNYARWLPVYLCDMNQLETDHPQTYQEFVNGNHAVSRSKQPFAQVWTDMALEQSINADSKAQGGIIGITKSPAALERWFLTCHERTSTTTALKDMYALQDSDRVGTHKEAAPKRVRRDENDVEKLVACFTSGMMIDPFSKGNDSLVNFATGVVMPTEDADSLVQSTEKGREQMNLFVTKRLNSNEVSFWVPVPNLKIKTFTTLTKKIQVKAADEKVITVGADRDLFGRLLIVANVRQINLKEVLSFELSPVPVSLAHPDGSLRKTNKSILSSLLEKGVSVLPRLPQPPPEITSVHIIDGMALVQMVKSGGAKTFGELAAKYFSIITDPLRQRDCNRVDVVFDQYWNISIKAGERLRRGSTNSLEIKINGPSTPVPKQWVKYIANPQNKVNLCHFLTESLCKLGQEKLPLDKKLVIGGGLNDGKEALSIAKDHWETVPSLKSDHEEADTRLMLHAKHAVQARVRMIVQSPDTDVFILCTSLFQDIGCEELWFRTGVRDRLRYIPVHDVFRTLGDKLCKALPGFHAVTGCDSTSSLSGIGKKRAWDVLTRFQVHQESLSLLGEQSELSQEVTTRCTTFICNLYPSLKKTSTSVDELRYLMFCQRKQKSELLPPTSGSLILHLKRANYQAFVWRNSLVALQELPSPEYHGWAIEDEALKPVLMDKDPAPRGILELTTCNCKKSACRSHCSCNINGLSCTEACFCMADVESCRNPHRVVPFCSESSDSEESDSE